VAFEFVDEWWKAGPPPKFSATVQETHGDFQASFPDGWMYEEWLGVTSQGHGRHSPFLRELRKAYFTLKELWTSQK
jgi:beta-glucuronidase